MKIRVFESPSRAARGLAREVARELASNSRLVLGLPTGRTPIPFYRELVSLAHARRLDFSHATTFNLDEFAGISPADPRSYRAFMRRNLFDHVNVSPRRIHFLDGSASEIGVECARFEDAIERAGGIDLMVLGLGANGHIGFNEPGYSLEARTHRTVLASSTRRANAAFFGRLSRVPREGLSMGMGTILRARRIVLFVTGRSKARCVRSLIRGRVTPRLPASFLQLHHDVRVWMDQAAASRLP